MFFPGETITHRFLIPFSKPEVDRVVISYKQKDEIILEKTVTSADLVYESEHVSIIEYALTQIESLLFSDNVPFTMQLNVYVQSGTRHTSHILNSGNGVQYFREVM